MEEQRKESQKICQVMMKTLETDNVQSELFQIYGKAKEKCKTFTELAKKYSRYKAEVIEMSQKEHKVLNAVDELMIEFNKEKADGSKCQERVDFLKRMDEACNQFNACYSTLQRGGHYYVQLAAHVDQLAQTINDFVMSRRIEKDEILAHASPDEPQG